MLIFHMRFQGLLLLVKVLCWTLLKFLRKSIYFEAHSTTGGGAGHPSRIQSWYVAKYWKSNGKSQILERHRGAHKLSYEKTLRPGVCQPQQIDLIVTSMSKTLPTFLTTTRIYMQTGMSPPEHGGDMGTNTCDVASNMGGRWDPPSSHGWKSLKIIEFLIFATCVVKPFGKSMIFISISFEASAAHPAPPVLRASKSLFFKM